jgi:hypothetical protein
MLGLDAEDAEGGKDAEEEGCSDGEEDGECEDGEVDGDAAGARDGELGVSGEAMDGEDGESDAEGASDEGEDSDFGESALEEMSGGGSERGADGGFSFPADDAGELRVRQIDARDEENAENGGHEEPEARGGAAYDDFLHGLDVGGERSLGGAVELVGRNLVGDIVGDDV